MSLVSILAVDQALEDTIWLVFTWFVLVPAILTGLIVVAIVSGRGEKREDAKNRGRWGTARRTPDE